MAGPPVSATEWPSVAAIPAEQRRKALTPANHKVLCGLARVLDREGSASIREIMTESGLASSSSVSHHLGKLAIYGYIEPPVRGRPRGWWLTARGWAAAGQS